MNLVSALNIVAFCLFLAAPVAAQTTLTLVYAPTGPIPGIAAIVLEKVYRRLDIALLFRPMPAARATLEAAAGRVDGDVVRIASYAQAHPSLIRVEPALSKVTTAAYYNQRSDLQVKSRDDLARYSLAYVRGIRASEQLSKGLPDVIAVNSVEVLFKMLQAKRFQIALAGVGEFKVQQQRYQPDQFVQVELASEPLYHYLHEKHRDLAIRVSAELAALAASGELASLQAQAEAEFFASQPPAGE